MAMNPEIFKEILKKSTDKIDTNNPMKVGQMRDAIINFDKHFKIGYNKKNDDYFLKQAIKIGDHLIDVLYKKKWHLLLSKDDDFFVTSDNPIAIIRPDNLPKFFGAGFINGILAIPISPSHCLFIVNSKEPSFTARAKSKCVNMINKHMMFYTKQFIYGHILSENVKSQFQYTKADAGQSWESSSDI